MFQGRKGKGAIYTFATGNGGILGDSCAYNGYVNSIFTIAISGVNPDNSRPSYAEECAGIMASAYSRDTAKGVGKVVSEVVKSLGFGLLFACCLHLYLSGPPPYGGPLLNVSQPSVFGNKSYSLFYNFVNMITTSFLSPRAVVIFFTILCVCHC